MKKEILFRLLKEFWFPAVLAILWTVYSVSQKNEQWTMSSFINVFGPSFFLASWATAQFFRIKKQTLVERNLTGIEDRLASLVSSLEGQTQYLIGHATGGDSVAYFRANHPVGTMLIDFSILNESEYPVFDIHAELVNIDEPTDFENGKYYTRQQFSVPSLYPNKIIMQAYRFDMRNLDLLRVNIFIQTRTKSLVQQFRVAREGQKFFYAHETRCGKEVLEKQIPEDFPGLDTANPENVFK